MVSNHSSGPEYTLAQIYADCGSSSARGRSRRRAPWCNLAVMGSPLRQNRRSLQLLEPQKQHNVERAQRSVDPSQQERTCHAFKPSVSCVLSCTLVYASRPCQYGTLPRLCTGCIYDTTRRVERNLVGIAAFIGLASKGVIGTSNPDATFELSQRDTSIRTLSKVVQIVRPGSAGLEADRILVRGDEGLLPDGSLKPVIGMVWSDLVLVWSRPPRLGLVWRFLRPWSDRSR
jgi:hypothetical protein